MKPKNIRVRIEQLRRIMHLAAEDKGISHPDVLRISKKLDAKLNEYARLVNQ